MRVLCNLNCKWLHFYDLDDWPKNSIKHFELKNCLFGATNIEKNSDKHKWVYSSYEIAFDSVDLWSFSRNVAIFGVDNSSSSHADNCKNIFLVLGEEPTDGIIDSIGAAEKKFSINFTKAKTKFYLSLHYNGCKSFFLLMEKKSISLKLIIKMSAFQLNFVLETYLINLVLLNLE